MKCSLTRNTHAVEQDPLSMSNTEIKTKHYQRIGKSQTVIAVLWPSFITAGIANSLFWIFVHPNEFGMITGFTEISNTGAYSIGFLILWFFTTMSSLGTQRSSIPCNDNTT